MITNKSRLIDAIRPIYQLVRPLRSRAGLLVAGIVLVAASPLLSITGIVIDAVERNGSDRLPHPHSRLVLLGYLQILLLFVGGAMIATALRPSSSVPSDAGRPTYNEVVP